MKKSAILLLLICLLLPACGTDVTVAPQVTVTFTSTPIPSATSTETPTPTATPIPTYSIEQLQAMTSEQKLALAPKVESAPEDVVASVLPAGAEAANVVWGQKSLTYWDRVVAYNGITADGQTVTMYFDLESGQWAKKYGSFGEVSQIPADQVPDVMVLTDAAMGDGRLIRAKLQYDYDWISQPQVMIDGKKVFRDEKGYPKAVWDTVSEKWLTPEEADVVWTFDKFKAVSDVPYIGDTGKERNYNYLFDPRLNEFLNDPSQIESLPNGTFILVLNPSGEMTVWTSQKEAANRAREGATIIVGSGKTQAERNENFVFNDKAAWKIAFDQYKKGNKSLFVTYGDVGVKISQIQGSFSTGVGYDVEELPQVIDSKTGKIVCPVIRLPKHMYVSSDVIEFTPTDDPMFWLNEVINSGVERIAISTTEDELFLK